MRIPFKEFVKGQLEDDAVLIACGLPATNKTETMEMVARLKGYEILRSDLIRLEVLKGEDIFDERVAANMDKRKQVYERMFAMADELVSRGKGVILDATFITQGLRMRAAQVAAKHRRRFIIQQTQCPEQYSLAKIAKRTKEDYESNALTPEAYYNNLRRFEPVDLDALKKQFPSLSVIHLVVDTGSDSEDEWYVIRKDAR